MTTENDIELVRQAQQDPEQFVLLYDKYIVQIYRYLYARTGHKQTAEDLTSQTFLQALESLPKYQSKVPSFAPWLFKIAKNLLINHYKKAKPLSLLDWMQNLISEENVSEQADKQLQLGQLQQMINNLPERDQEIVTLRTYDDLSFSEIGEILKISENAARVAYHRAIGKMTTN